MPGGDRTGPRGMGPRTGRAAGYCSGTGMPGYSHRPFGSGGGMGFGRGMWGRGFGGGGRGWRNMFFATGLPGWRRFGGYDGPGQDPDPKLEKEALRNQAKALQSELDLVKKRLDEMDPEVPEE